MTLNFRKAGFSDDAINYPLTDGGCRIIAMHNGVSAEAMPQEWHYAPNRSMQQWINALGDRLDRDLPVRHESGRWLLPSEIL